MSGPKEHVGMLDFNCAEPNDIRKGIVLRGDLRS